MKTIAAAIVAAQKTFGPALKTSTNPHFQKKYADLSACIEAVIDALNNNGIALIQNSFECDNGVIVETMFLHESGETLSAGKLRVPAPKQDPQGFGSALTYARRYSLMAACGIAPEDDDGNAASANGNKQTPPAASANASPPKSAEAPKPPVTDTSKISDPQRKRFYAKVKASGKTDDEVKRHLYETYAIESSKDIPRNKYDEACEWADKVLPPPAPPAGEPEDIPF